MDSELLSRPSALCSVLDTPTRHTLTEDYSNKLAKHIQWSTSDEENFVPVGRTLTNLIPGYYEINVNEQIGLYFRKIPVKTDGLINFPDSNTHTIVEEIKKFWESEAIYAKFGIARKRGIILTGDPGTGKTCTLQQVCRDVIGRDGIVIKFGTPGTFVEGMRILRSLQPNTPVVVLMEDIDSTLEYCSETDVLNILDGVERISNVVFLATTNYPERLGKRIINRPSRFDKRFIIDYPNSESRKIYLEFLSNGETIKNFDLDKWVEDTENFSIAHLKELFVAVVVFDNTYEETIKTLKDMSKELNSWDNSNSNDEIGFVKNHM